MSFSSLFSTTLNVSALISVEEKKSSKYVKWSNFSNGRWFLNIVYFKL